MEYPAFRKSSSVASCRLPEGSPIRRGFINNTYRALVNRTQLGFQKVTYTEAINIIAKKVGKLTVIA